MTDDEAKRTLWDRCGDTTPRDRRNTVRMLVALAVWAVVFVAATWAIRKELLPTGPISWIVAALPSALMVVALLAYADYLRKADELQRAIQLQALALGFGAGWLALCGYPLFERLGAPAIDPGDYVIVMAVCFSLGVVLGQRRYK
jgi:predicted MFS family arabinose efflux permease